jgi:antitoxin HicB
MTDNSDKPRPTGHRSSLDDLLTADGVLEQVQATAIKEGVAWQIQQAMTEKKLSKNKMAQLMHTSRAQLDRLLDSDGNVTLDTLQRAATVFGPLDPAGAGLSAAGRRISPAGGCFQAVL